MQGHKRTQGQDVAEDGAIQPGVERVRVRLAANCIGSGNASSIMRGIGGCDTSF